MRERLMEKLARLGAEAGIKQMTPEIYKFSWLLNEDKNKIWDEWVKKRLEEKRTWVGLTDDEIDAAWGAVAWHSSKGLQELRREYARAVLAKSKELNT